VSSNNGFQTGRPVGQGTSRYYFVLPVFQRKHNQNIAQDNGFPESLIALQIGSQAFPSL